MQRREDVKNMVTRRQLGGKGREEWSRVIPSELGAHGKAEGELVCHSTPRERETGRGSLGQEVFQEVGFPSWEETGLPLRGSSHSMLRAL